MEIPEGTSRGVGWSEVRSQARGRAPESSSDHLGLTATHFDAGRSGIDAPFSHASAVPEVAAPVVYLDRRTFTRDCIGRWLQSHLGGFTVCALQDPDQIMTATAVSDDIRAVIVNTSPDQMSSAGVASLMSRVAELVPGVPVAVLSEYEDPENIRAAFELGVRGYIPTSLAPPVAIQAVHLVCAGGTFAPAAALLSSPRARSESDGSPLIDGFTQRQGQILGCMRRGMSNKLIAYELSMCESTVKVHIRNIMKKLGATNRTEAVYLTNGLFEAGSRHDRAG